MEKNKKEKWISFLACFVSAMIVCILYVCSNPTLSKAEDLNIAGLLVSDTEPGFYFITPYIAYPLHFLYQMLPQISWWPVFSVFSVWLMLVCVGYALTKLQKEKVVRSICLALFYGVVWYGICSAEINFTQTAACFSVAGSALILWNNYYGEKKKIIIEVIGSCIFLCGWLVRWKAAMFCLPFELLIGFHIFVKDLLKEKRFQFGVTCKRHIGSLMLVALSFFAIGLMLVYGMLHPDWKEYYEANSLRESIYDYQQQYPEYSEMPELYNEISVNQSMLTMIENNYTSDKDIFTADRLKRIQGLKEPNTISQEDIRKVIEKFAAEPFCLICMLVLFCFLFLYYRRFAILPILYQLGFIFCCSAYLAYIGRVAWRVLVCILLAGSFSVIFILAAEPIRQREKKEKRMEIIFLIVCVLFMIPAVKQYDFETPEAKVVGEKKAEVLDYIDAHKENVYALFYRRYRYYSANSVWSSPAVGYCDNLITMRTHFALGKEKLLQSYGISNLYKDMLVKDNILSNYDEIAYEYLCETYDKNTTVSFMDSVGKAKFVRYMRPIFPEESNIIENSAENNSKFSVLRSAYNAEKSRFVIDFQLEDTNKNNYYINIETPDGNLYTYACKWKENTLSADFMLTEHIKSNMEGVKIYLVKEQEQKYTYEADVTNAIFEKVEAM